MRPPRLAAAAVLLAFVLGLGAGACFVRERGSTRGGEAAAERKLTAEEERTVEVFRDASRAVVNISTNARVRRGFLSLDVEEVPQGTGSGVVWDKQGHILTNFHVIVNADSISVILADQSVYREAKVVGRYPDKDVAVLRIDAPAEKLQPIRLGRSSELLVGMQAIAIGNPFGLDQTLTVGVISALGREMQALTGRRITDVIQTDAAINPGNSGGPLLNSSGELVGITTAIHGASRTNAGIGFAVPMDAIRRVVVDLIEHGKIIRPGLGVELFSDAIARRWGFQGVWVKAVAPNSAAASSGLRGTKVYTDGEVEPGDVILGLDGKPTRELNDLLDCLESHQVGDEVELTFQRDGKNQKTKVRLQQIEVSGD